MADLADAALTNWLMNGYLTTVAGNPVTYPGLANFSPIAGDDLINASACTVMAGQSATPNAGIGAAVWSDGLPPQTFGKVTANVKIHGTFTTPAHVGICVLLSSTALAPGAGAQGYALVLDTLSNLNRIRLLQLTDGGSHPVNGGASPITYTLLAETEDNAFTAGQSVALQLEWYVDAVHLQGVFLRATANGAFLWQIVYTGPAAYLPANAATSRYGLLGYQSTNPIVLYVDDVVMQEGDTA